jgi:hypothetical protein
MASPLNTGQDMGVAGAQPGQQPMMGGTDITAMASTIAQQLSQMDAAQQYLSIKKLREQSPELADLVLQFLASMGGLQQQPQQGVPGADGAAATQVDTRPLPEQKPPRRAAASV